ncbi:MAG: phosphoribosylformylglycinamidine synthase I [Thermoguttaceae bacterium]
MPSPHVLILRAPGTNCDKESAFAFQKAGAKTETLHVNRLLEEPRLIERFQILCLPGGFSYGDDVAAGRILANQIEHHLADAMARFKADGKLILGICNGFQVMIKSGILLPSEPGKGPPATLTLNDSGRYEDRWVRLRVEGQKCVFFRGIESMYLPVAHGEGKFITRDAAVLDELDAAGQLVLRYVSQRNGGGPVAFPDNPNGSLGHVAGLCDASGRVLGLMPHPERHIDPTQHPRWTRGEAAAVGDGLQVFLNAVGYFR